MFVQGNDGEIIGSLWHGIPPNANADRVWMPTGYSEGNVAIDSDEIVIDAHVTDALGLSIGDLVKIGAGISTHEFEIVGIGYHPQHVIMAPEGSFFPPEDGEYVVGYLSDSGMAKLTGNEIDPVIQSYWISMVHRSLIYQILKSTREKKSTQSRKMLSRQWNHYLSTAE